MQKGDNSLLRKVCKTVSRLCQNEKSSAKPRHRFAYQSLGNIKVNKFANFDLNIARSEQRSHTPGGSHQRL